MTRCRRLAVCLCVGLAMLGVSLSAQKTTTTGTLATKNDTVPVSIVNVASATIQLTGTWAGQVVFEATVDNNATWQALTVFPSTSGAAQQATGINGTWIMVNPGYTALRVRAAAWDSGTGTVTVTRGFATGSSPSTVTAAPIGAGLPLPLCNPVRNYNCQSKGF